MSLFIGRLPRDLRSSELEALFKDCGVITRCDVKPGGYGFVEFKDDRDAADVIRDFHGKTHFGGSITVEWARGKRRMGGDFYPPPPPPSGMYGGRGGYDRYPPPPMMRYPPPPYGARDYYPPPPPPMMRSNDCFRCGRPGHFARDCTFASSSGSYRGGRSRSPVHGNGERRSRSPPPRGYRDNEEMVKASRSRSPPPPRGSRSPSPDGRREEAD